MIFSANENQSLPPYQQIVKVLVDGKDVTHHCTVFSIREGWAELVDISPDPSGEYHTHRVHGVITIVRRGEAFRN